MSRVDNSPSPMRLAESALFVSPTTASLRKRIVITALHGIADCAGALFCGAGHARLRLESITRTRHGLDVPRRAPLVVELHAQLADVTVDDVALDLELAAPDRCEQVLATQRLSGVRGQEIEERLLDRREVKVATAHGHALLDQVHFEAVEPDRWHDRD